MLIYVIVPAVIFAVVAALAMLGGSRRRGRRYRPGRPYEFTPVWFLSNAAGGAEPGGGRELAAGGTYRALPATSAAAGLTVQERPAGPRGTGGASDRW
ncbi:aa3-type cytochrome oxidase subunit CtaJ [Rhizomonospora bruguierae]|uniref:aa3-type cytochrome oxidase subunit CtaJ n=1 Tax=Rhizomonospora bruguierae TaxID=1581705 RepID=UPI001BD02BC3|nr:hypothetical protein [Micromonospora sp. NBRC 107566]